MSADVRVRDLGYAYPGGRVVLDGISLNVDAGEKVAVLGANGAGKSTLLLHLNGLLEPDRGVVEVGGIPVGPDTVREIRARVGMVFQDPDDQLFLPTLLEDVAFGPLNQGVRAPEAETLARDRLAAFGLAEAAHRAAHHLSGGEKRLASLATVLVLDPDVLVLDEPTAGLDARGRKQVVELLAHRSETLVVATHDLAVARAVCFRSVILGSGGVAADGPTGEILAREELLTRWGLLDPLDG